MVNFSLRAGMGDLGWGVGGLGVGRGGGQNNITDKALLVTVDIQVNTFSLL